MYRSYTHTCYYVLFLFFFYTTISDCMIFYGPIVPEINYYYLFLLLYILLVNIFTVVMYELVTKHFKSIYRVM